MLPDFSSRSSKLEWMDDPAVDTTELRKTLDDLARVNFMLRGHAPSLDGIERLADDEQRRLSVLDVGTGGGDVPRRLAVWAKKKKVDLFVHGIDLSQRTVDHARHRSAAYPNIEFTRQDLFDLDGEKRFDIVHSALMLHHLNTGEAAEGLQKMYEISRLGVVINDLHRHPVGYFGSRIILPLLSRNPMIRHDGSLSVLRAFTEDELRGLAKRAGLPDPQIQWWPLFRWQMILRREQP